MKNLTLLIMAIAILFVYSCKPAEVEKPIPTAAFKAVFVKHLVKDFDVWKPLYVANSPDRVANGLYQLALGRGLDEPNMVFTSFLATDLQKAKTYVTAAGLKMMMDSAGVMGPPIIDYLDVIRFDSTDRTTKTRMIAKFKVKDFDVFLKEFDKEGRSTRASHGILDRAMARGADDPNMVYMIVNISDVAMAKARLASDELKALMDKSGLEGPPETFMFSVIE